MKAKIAIVAALLVAANAQAGTFKKGTSTTNSTGYTDYTVKGVTTSETTQYGKNLAGDRVLLSQDNTTEKLKVIGSYDSYAGETSSFAVVSYGGTEFWKYADNYTDGYEGTNGTESVKVKTASTGFDWDNGAKTTYTSNEVYKSDETYQSYTYYNYNEAGWRE